MPGMCLALRGHVRLRPNPTTDSSRGKRVKIVILGATGVGKTTLFRRLLDQPLPRPSATAENDEHAPTTSANIGAKLVLLESHAPVLVELWDIPDQVYAGKGVFDSYLQAVDGAILVYDVASPSSWQAVVDYFTLVSAHAAPYEADAQSRRVAIAVVGNKIDTEPRNATPDTLRLAQEWTNQQQQQQRSLIHSVHHTIVSAVDQLHTLELVRSIVQALVSEKKCTLPVAISNASK